MAEELEEKKVKSFAEIIAQIKDGQLVKIINPAMEQISNLEEREENFVRNINDLITESEEVRVAFKNLIQGLNFDAALGINPNDFLALAYIHHMPWDSAALILFPTNQERIDDGKIPLKAFIENEKGEKYNAVPKGYDGPTVDGLVASQFAEVTEFLYNKTEALMTERPKDIFSSTAKTHCDVQKTFRELKNMVELYEALGFDAENILTEKIYSFAKHGSIYGSHRKGR